MSQTVIQSPESIIVDLPTIRSHKLVIYIVDRQTLVTLRLRCSDGAEDLGEATTIGDLAYSNESPGSIKSSPDAHFAPLPLDQPADNVNAAMRRLDRHIRGDTFARSAVEIALFDARGKRLGLAASEPLGGHLHDSLEVAWTLVSGNTGYNIERAERMLDLRRHRYFKLKIGVGEVDVDVAHAIAIKHTLGKCTSVWVDVNQVWDEDIAQRACAILGDNGIAPIEQPIARHNCIGLVYLSSHGDVPIMTDKAIESVENAFHLARKDAAPVFALEIAKNGRPRAVPHSAAITETARIGLYGGTMPEGGIGILAATHVFATLDRLAWRSELFGPLLLVEDTLLESPRYQDFRLHVPHVPGFGLVLDEERLACLRRR